MLDFICNGSVDLFGKGRERKIQNENICLQQDSNPRHASPWQESQLLRPLGHEGLMVMINLMSYRIMEYLWVCFVVSGREFQTSVTLVKPNAVVVILKKTKSSELQENEQPDSRLQAPNCEIGREGFNNRTIYWEADISFHLRGCQLKSDIACIGMWSLPEQNTGQTNDIGVALKFGKAENGTPIISYCQNENLVQTFNITPSRQYHLTYGFYFDENLMKLSMINLKENKVMLTTNKLTGSACDYLPIFITYTSQEDRETHIKFRTGSDIAGIPSCVNSLCQ